MSALKDSLIAFLVRTVIAAPFFLIGWFLISRRAGIQGTAGFVLLAVALFLAGAVIVGPALARLLAEPWGSFFAPEAYYDRPQPMYGIPEAKRHKGQLEEAMQDYDAIAEQYPRDVRPYVEMIDIAVRELRDETRAQAVYERGMQRLRREEDRTHLSRMYQAIRSRPAAAHPAPLPAIKRRGPATPSNPPPGPLSTGDKPPPHTRN